MATENSIRRTVSDNTDTIAAIATPPGKGGVGIVRVAGPAVSFLAEKILRKIPAARFASYLPFFDADEQVIDQGICLYFPSPHSFTGDDILEFQAHGGPVVLDQLLERCLELGARLARPGEFSERAFFNGKLDLAQAEAIADLIDSGTRTAARMAVRTLQGRFSRRIEHLASRIVDMRTAIEAAVDFPDEDIEWLQGDQVVEDWQAIIDELEGILTQAQQGQLLRDGITLVIAGRPNAGKSSLLNALSGKDAAIVTELPGTTRDLLRERIQIDGMPLHLVDTAGLRKGEDPVEKEGVRRAREEIARADRILWVFDDREDPGHDDMDRGSLPPDIPITLIRNKIDLTATPPGWNDGEQALEIAISAITGEGMDILLQHLKQCVGYRGPEEGEYMARRRHLDALSRTRSHLHSSLDILHDGDGIELLAEELRLAHLCLSEITGEFLTEDLLGEIFSRFCIGK